jgi:hypothetical protein
MKKKFALLAVGLMVTALFVGCGKKQSSEEVAKKEAVKALTDFATAQQKIGQNIDPNDPAAVAKTMENYAEFGAKLELQDFEKSEAVDAPSDFPSSLVYGKGKITSSSDSSNESYINKSITIKTTDDLKAAKDFYKNLFSKTPWKIASQSSEADGASYTANDSNNFEASVYISSNTYSKIVEVQITYSGSVAAN